jgi:protein-L-isoaspartate(D-aspartate) O-methyltransferase
VGVPARGLPNRRPNTIATVPDPTSAGRRRDLVRRLRGAGHLRDDRVASAFSAVPRELFLAAHAQRHGLAEVYRDDAIVTRRDPATGHPTSSSSQPAIMARMLEMLGVGPGDRVLEIGAGTGYNAALLAQLVGGGGAVTSVELDADVAVDARRALLSAKSQARVEMGDGSAGWPPAAPVDAIVATASVDRIPRAWFDQVRPGGRLVVPLRISPVVKWVQAVVALRKVRTGFETVAVTPGAFMPLRIPDGTGRGRASRLVVGEMADGGPGRSHVELTGPALAGLDRSARQRLVLTALGFARRRPVPLGGGSVLGLLAYVSLALPEERLVEIERSGGPGVREALGTVDAVDGSLALLVPEANGRVRIDAYGGHRAERGMLSAVERWALAGRPTVADAQITVRYGSVRPHGWHSTRRGDQWIALDWRRDGEARQ